MFLDVHKKPMVAHTPTGYDTGVVYHVENANGSMDSCCDSVSNDSKVTCKGILSGSNPSLDKRENRNRCTGKNSHGKFSKYYTELPERYQIIQKIGEGAFSKVFKVLDTACDAYIAIKIMDKKGMGASQINSAMKEIAIMRRLRHKNIVRLYGYQNTQKSRYCFLYMEYVAGGEIFNQIIKYTYFSEDLARHIIRQVANAVKYLHDNGVVHRDIKPENLLFMPVKLLKRPKEQQIKARRKSDDNKKIDEGRFVRGYGSAGIGVVKVADFGLSTVLVDDQTRAQTPCGTVGYTSPEQHLRLGYTKKVDLWAIGCVLYTLVVGFPPFYSNSGNSKDISRKVSRGDYKFLSPWFDEVSQECKNLISNLLTVDPEKRYSIEDLLRDPWLNKGYEDVLMKKKSIAAADAPDTTTFDKDLYSKFTNNLVTENNVEDYFGVADQQLISTPRAEAIRIVFDTGTTIQRSKQSVKASKWPEARVHTPFIPHKADNPTVDTLSVMQIHLDKNSSSSSMGSFSSLDSSDAANDHMSNVRDDNDNDACEKEDDDVNDDVDVDDVDDDVDDVDERSIETNDSTASLTSPNRTAAPPEIMVRQSSSTRVSFKSESSFSSSSSSSCCSCSPVSFPESAPEVQIVGAEIRDDEKGTRRRSSVSFKLQRSKAPVTANLRNTLLCVKSAKEYEKSPYPKQIEGSIQVPRVTKFTRKPTPYVTKASEPAFDLKLEKSTILTRRRLSMGSIPLHEK